MSLQTDLVEGFFRDQWADRLVDTCTITRLAGQVFDDVTGTYSAGTPATVYSGACLVRPKSASDAQAGEELVELRGYLVVVPWDTDGAQPDDLVTVTTTRDGVLDGKVLVVRNVRADSWNTARKLDCEDNQGG